MISYLQNDPHVRWQQRFRLPAIVTSEVTPANTSRVLVCGHNGDMFQFHWGCDPERSAPRRLGDRHAGRWQEPYHSTPRIPAAR